MTKQEEMNEMTEFLDEMWIDYPPRPIEVTEALYNVGYRRVLFKTEDGYVVDCPKYAPWELIKGHTEREVEKARKETVKEILTKIRKEFKKAGILLDFSIIAKQYGVEIEE